MRSRSGRPVVIAQGVDPVHAAVHVFVGDHDLDYDDDDDDEESAMG